MRTSDPDRLASTLAGRGLSLKRRDGGIQVTTEDLAMVGDLAHAADIAIHELRAEKTHLEELYFNLTDSDQHRNRNLGGPVAPLGRCPAERAAHRPELLAVTPDTAPASPAEPETQRREEAR